MNKQLVKMSENLIDNIKDIENNENKQHRNQIIQILVSIRTNLRSLGIIMMNMYKKKKTVTILLKTML